jgi:hypothetical protein
MVRAIREGRKTQTRRVLGSRSALYPGPRDVTPEMVGDGVWGWVSDGVILAGIGACPYGQPGDRLWVRETWAVHSLQMEGQGTGYMLQWRADGATRETAWDGGRASQVGETGDDVLDCCRRQADKGWRPSIHMPRWASRLTLAVTEIRVERLQAISEEDARAEGCSGRQQSLDLWDSMETTDGIKSRRGCSWADNPWVWVVSFCPACQCAWPELTTGHEDTVTCACGRVLGCAMRGR